MSTDLRVALVGYGLAGRVFHAPLLAATAGLAVSHVVTADPDRRAAVRADLPDAALLGVVDELWSRAGEVDVVVVAAANAAHVPVAQAAIGHGLAVVVDKPLAIEAGAARGLADAAARAGVLLTVFQNRRWDSDTRTVRRLLAEGRLGEVVRFESRFTRFRPQVGDRWRENDPAAGGGLLLDLGSHLVDQAVQLFGPVRAVAAEVDARRQGARAEDDVFVALEHAGGVRSHLWASAVAPWTGPRVVVQGSRAGYLKDDLDGQEAALRAGRRPDGPGWGGEPPGRLYDGDGPHEVASEPGAWPEFYRLLERALRTGGPPPVDPYDAVAVLEVLAAARRAAAERRVVTLD